MSREQVSVIARPIQARFIPQPDITAFELAQIVRLGGASPAYMTFMPGQWVALDPGIKRHFETA
jgi:hypothetical protein